MVKCCLLPREIKFIYSSHRVISFLLYRQEYFCTNNSVRAENDVIEILTSEDMENTLLESRMQFRVNVYASGLFPLKHPRLCHKEEYVTTHGTGSNMN